MPRLPFHDHRLDPEYIGDRAARGCLGGIFDQISGCIWSIIIGVMVMLMVLAAGGYAVYLAMNPDTSSVFDKVSIPSSTDASWDGRSTFVCEGHDKTTLSDVTAKLGESPAILAKDHCVLRLEGVKVSAPVALRVEGHARVTLEGCNLRGKTHAIDAAGHAVVTVEGGNLESKGVAVKADGHAKVSGLSSAKLKGDKKAEGRHSRVE